MERKWWTLVAVAAGTFMLLLDVTIVNVALPDIEIALHASLADLQWVIDAYALTLAALLLTAGSLADRFGRRLLFAIGIVAFTLGSLLCGLAPSSLFLTLSRAFQGIGGAIMFATGLALIANAFHGRDRGAAFGVFGAVTGIAVAVGPVLGGALTSGLSWRWIFLVNIPVGIAAFAVTLREVDESRDPHPRRIDWIGLVTFSVGLGALVYGLIRAGEDGWSIGAVIVSLIAAAVLLVAFVAAEALQARPMFDLSLFRKPTFVGGLIAAFAISASLFAMFPYLVIYMQIGLGLSAIEVGVRFLVLSGPVFITAAIAGRLTEHMPIRFLIGPGFALVGVALLLMRGLAPGQDWTHLIPGFLIAGIGAGLINVPLASTAVGVVEPARAGMASGINSTLRQVGIATGVAALGTIFSHHTAHATSRLGGFVDGLNAILLVGAVLAFVAAASSLLLIRRKDFVRSSPA
ncbi:MAG TPA: DHA2 family efflux MFS transporter permease subunit [Solirubrobacter sp.]|nr:DHA2 family efflux MFS transporter permease subunit [Solirubrobacter sp.]